MPPAKVGELNGKWAAMFRLALASYPFVIAYVGWDINSTIQNNRAREAFYKHVDGGGHVIKDMTLEVTALTADVSHMRALVQEVRDDVKFIKDRQTSPPGG